jgi:formylglycine-generating enzyme required for sulfatase activity/serine/threonine protein kinase/Flp pilus assembly protein TadD
MKICPTCQQTYSDDVEFCPRDGAHLTTHAAQTEAQLAGQLSRRFRLVRRLGAGAMGTVLCRAERRSAQGRARLAPTRLKVLNRKLLDDPEFLLRFQNEAASTGRIHHPNVVTIHESGQADDGTPYIAMEFLEGESLRQALSRRGALPLPEVAEILQQAARGLNAAHKLGIIHRDLKPDNIFLTRGDEGETIVKIVDFGIAKLRESATHTQTGMVLGTPAYMSFEQASGMRSDELDARSDIYSLGVVTYEMLTGRAPFQSDTPVGYLRMHMQEDPPPFRTVKPDLPALPQLESVVMKALTKDRNQRYRSVLEFAHELSSAAQPSRRAEAPIPPPFTRIVSPPAATQLPQSRTTPKSPGKMKFAAIAGVALIVILAGVWYFSHHSQHPDVTSSNEATLANAYHVTAFRDGAYIIEHKGHRLTAKCRECLTWPDGPDKPGRPMTDHDCLYMSGLVGRSIGDDLMRQDNNTLVYSPWTGVDTVQTADLLDITNDELIRTGSGLRSAQEQVAPPVEAKLSQMARTPGEVRENAKDGLKYVWIPPGTFMMGCSPADNECSAEEKPAHQVKVTKGFWMGQAEVTVGAYKRFAAATGRQMPPEPNSSGRPLNPGWRDEAMPIVDVTWDDAEAYCRWAGGRLPTEAEWEYAARAGSTGARYGDLDEIAWYADNSGRERLDSTRIWNEDLANYGKRLNENGNSMHEVSQKRANAFGLYDMLGNVWEWVNDWYDESYYHNSPSQNPTGPASGQLRVLRGGSWLYVPRYVRVSNRVSYFPADRYDYGGFRCGGEVAGQKAAASQSPTGASQQPLKPASQPPDTKGQLAEKHFLKGDALFSKADLNGAIAEYREAIRLKPDVADAHGLRGLELEQEGDFDGAIAEYREMVRLRPNDARAHFGLGVNLGLKGDRDGEITEEREAIRLKPDNAEAHFNLGLALGEKGDLGAAISEFRMAIRLKADYAMAHNALGLALEQKGELQPALEEYRKAYELAPKNPTIRGDYEKLVKRVNPQP